MSELEVGQIVADTYKIVGKLGQGGMGTVYEAEHQRTQKRVAMKVLRGGLGHAREVVQRFEREARATSHLNHPGIVKVEDFGPVGDGLFLVMEILPGPTLRQALDAGLTRERAFLVVRQILAALSHAHALGVIHRDLKPDNVKLVRDSDGGGERAKVLDFGIARVIGEARDQLDARETLTEIGIAFGTPDYMSPEQALGQPADARADVYAAGVILFEALTGRRPFLGEDPISVARQHVAMDPPTLAEAAPGSEFSTLSEALVARALAKRPAQRFADAFEMMAAIDDAAAAEGIVLAHESNYTPLPRLATPTPIAVPLAPPRPMARWKKWAFAAAGVLLVGGGLAAGVAGGDGTQLEIPRGSATTLNLAALIPPPPSAVAREALDQLAAGDSDAALATLDRGLAAPGGERDATAHLVRGHVKLVQSRPVEGLAAYERAVTLAPALADDEQLRDGLAGLVRGKDVELAGAALELAARGQLGRELVVEAASTGKSHELRKRARALAEKLDLDGRIDRFAAASADLVQAPSCPERKAAVAVLRGLGDVRAVPLLKKARGRSSGFFGTGRPNACLVEDAKAAIDELEKK